LDPKGCAGPVGRTGCSRVTGGRWLSPVARCTRQPFILRARSSRHRSSAGTRPSTGLPRPALPARSNAPRQGAAPFFQRFGNVRPQAVDRRPGELHDRVIFTGDVQRWLEQLTPDEERCLLPVNVLAADRVSAANAAATPLSPAARCRRSNGGCIYASRRFSANRCLLHRCCRGQCNLALLRPPRSPAPSTRSSARRLWARSTLEACAKPSASGSAVGKSATPTASDLHHPNLPTWPRPFGRGFSYLGAPIGHFRLS
jgi:hypothetical protein